MTRVITFLLMVLMACYACNAQNCSVLWPPPYTHNVVTTPKCWAHAQWVGTRKHDNAYELCNRTGNWALMFEDNFNGDKLDRSIWQVPNDFNYYQPGDDDISVFNTYNNTNVNSNYVVSDGTLKMLVKMGKNQAIYNLDRDKYEHSFTAGQLISWHQYPAGLYEIRFRVPSTYDINFAPLWLNNSKQCDVMGQVYYQEIDIEMGLNHQSTNVPSWTFHRRPPTNNEGNCSDGQHSTCSNGANYADGKFHTMVIDWDPYRIVWYIDGRVFRTIFRTYGLWGATYVNECKGPPIGWWYMKNDMMPLFTNMNIFSCMAVNKDYTGGNQQMEIDYIRAYRNLDCSKVVNLCEFRTTSLKDATPPITPQYDDETAAVITGGTIIVAGNGCRYKVARNCSYRRINQDLLASKAIYLNPGFSMEPFSSDAGDPADHDIFQAKIVGCGNSKNFELAELEPVPEPEMTEEKELQSERINMESMGQYNADMLYLMVYPNPAKDYAKIDYILPVDDVVDIVIMDINGRVVQELDYGARAAAAYGLTVNTADINPGIYFVQMATVGGYRESKRLVIIR